MNVPGKANQKVEEVTMTPDIGKGRFPQFKNIFTTAQKLKRKGKIHSDLLQEETKSLLLHRPGTKSKNITWVHGWGKCICMCGQGNMDFRMTDHNPGPAGVGEAGQEGGNIHSLTNQVLVHLYTQLVCVCVCVCMCVPLSQILPMRDSTVSTHFSF